MNEFNHLGPTGKKIVLHLKNEESTQQIANQLAERAFVGMFLALDGDLGAGKTTFTQYFAKALGITEIVNSPTFTLVREYEEGRFPLYHMDLYRLQAREVFELGFDEYWYGHGISVVEWSTRVEMDELPQDRLSVFIRLLDDGTREWDVVAYGESYEALLQTWQLESEESV